MQFLIAVLAIRFVAELISQKIEKRKADKSRIQEGQKNEVSHPAEYNLR